MKEKSPTRKRRLGQVLFIFSLVFLIFGLFSLAWVVWPTPREAVTMEIPAGVLPGAPAGQSYASLTDYALSLTWPRWMRPGDPGRVNVFLSEIDPMGDRPVQVVIAETNLGSLPVEPSGQIQTSLGAGQDLEMGWTVSGVTPGEFPGEVIVSFGFYDEEFSELVAVPVAVIDIEIQVISLFALETGMVLWLGIIGMVFWGALFILGRVVQH